MKTINKNHPAFKIGLKDGAEMARESDSADAGPDGWDGLALNAAGFAELVRVFGLPEGTDRDSDEFLAAMAAYVAGCQEGADAQVLLNHPVAVEFAVCDETIRTCAIDDLIGLEHTAAAEACAAYHRAATQSLIDDERAGRLTVSSPRGQRRLHSQWMGSGFKFSSGGIGTMGDLTEDEKAAVSAADDAGREAAKKIVEAAEAAEIQ